MSDREQVNVQEFSAGDYIFTRPSIDCPCGGGQSYIVMRREVGVWVHEDIVMKAAGLPIRENCSQHTVAQQQALEDAMSGYDSVSCY